LTVLCTPSHYYVYFCMMLQPPLSTLFPYTTLFRSHIHPRYVRERRLAAPPTTSIIFPARTQLRRSLAAHNAFRLTRRCDSIVGRDKSLPAALGVNTAARVDCTRPDAHERWVRFRTAAAPSEHIVCPDR